VFEGSVTAGGALMNTTEVENFPGFPDAIMVRTSWTRAQAGRAFGAELLPERLRVDLPARSSRSPTARHRPRARG